MGVTRTGVWTMLVGETALVAVFASVLGALAGAAYGVAGAAALTGTLNGGNIPVPVDDLVKVGAGGVLAAIAAAGLAALGAIRAPATGA